MSVLRFVRAVLVFAAGASTLHALQLANHPVYFVSSQQQTQQPVEQPQAAPEVEPLLQHPMPAQAEPSGSELLPSELPRLGQAQGQAAAPALSLEQLERLALENNPTLRQAAAEIQAASGRRLQAGLWPNPRVGYTGEEVRGGDLRGGQQGFFVEQSIILGGKLRLGRRVFEQEIRLAEIEAEEQRLRVLNAVRLGYYQVLTSQETIATLRTLARIAADNVGTSNRLRNIGQADDTETLQSEIEVQQAELAVVREEIRLRHRWTALATVVGRPDLPLATLDGRLDENLPDLNQQALLNSLLRDSPQVRITEANVARADAQLARERRVPVPDLLLRGGLQQNRELVESSRQPVGLQGFAEIGIQIPIFNRNQGSVQAATAARERAEQEKTRVQLVLWERASAMIQAYADARARAERYRNQILPRAQRAYQLMLQRWGQMAASYPQLLITQRTLFQAQTDYIASLGDLWASALTLRGFLLTDGLEAPARPGEVDLPIREINVPTPRGMPGREE